ncbi:MAG: preprotein translocase subunit YajC [Rhodospirillaceae bacterium]|nr:preprotein translocase subunit YajC [Rhodospirillaceae bacterium]
MWISPAYAQAAGGDAGGAFTAFVPLILIFVIFYFLLIRPQQKKMKEHKAMLGAIRRGDKVVTNGGIIGLVTKVVDDRELQVEIAENVRVRVLRDMVASVMGKTEPAPAKDGKDKDGKDKDKSDADDAKDDGKKDEGSKD